MTDDVTHLRALLADATARAEKAEAERDAALAACAEMRAALTEIIARGQEQRGTGRMIETAEAALSRPDLGAGMVVMRREKVERFRRFFADGPPWTPGDPERRAFLDDLDALLKKGGG